MYVAHHEPESGVVMISVLLNHIDVVVVVDVVVIGTSIIAICVCLSVSVSVGISVRFTLLPKLACQTLSTCLVAFRRTCTRQPISVSGQPWRGPC